MSDQVVDEVNEEAGSDPDKLYSLRTASAYCGVGATAVRYWILTGKVPAEMVDGQWQIRQADLDVQNQRSKEFAGGVLREKRGKLAKPAVKRAEHESGEDSGAVQEAGGPDPDGQGEPAVLPREVGAGGGDEHANRGDDSVGVDPAGS